MKDYKKKYRYIMPILKEEIENLTRIFGQNEKYAKLLQIIEESPEYSPPTQKELLKRLQLKRQTLMHLLYDLFTEFGYSIVDDGAYLVSKSKVVIIVKMKDESRELVVKGLQTIPRIGEEFNIYFYGAFCRVSDVNHILTGGVHQIFIHLEDRPFDYSKYLS